MKKPECKAAKEEVLHYLSLLIAQAPEGPPIPKFRHRSTYDTRITPGLEELGKIEFSIGSTRYSVWNESARLELVRAQVKKLPLECFELKVEF